MLCHWLFCRQCGFKRHLNHLKNIHKVSSPEAITGFEALKSADKFKVREAWYERASTTRDTAHVGTPTTTVAKTPGKAEKRTPGKAEKRTPGQQATIPRSQPNDQVQLSDIPRYDQLTATDRAKVWEARAAGKSYDDLRDLVDTLYTARANRV